MDFLEEGPEVNRAGKKGRGLAAATALLIAWAGSVFVQMRVDREIIPYHAAPDMLWVTSPRAVKTMSMGHQGLLADIYWTRVVQYYGSRVHKRQSDFSQLYPLLDITTTLDPQLLVAYYFGAFFLSQPPPTGAGEPHHAIALLYKGLAANPEIWRFHHFIGFTYYWDLQDYEKAAAAYREGARNPEARDWMRVMAAQITERGGSRETSYFLWSEIYNATSDPTIRQNALGHLQALQAQKDLEELETLTRRYQQQNGRWPGSLREMAAAGMFQREPVDPAGLPYQIGPDGTVSLHPESTIKLEYGSAPKPPVPSTR